MTDNNDIKDRLLTIVNRICKDNKSKLCTLSQSRKILSSFRKINEFDVSSSDPALLLFSDQPLKSIYEFLKKVQNNTLETLLSGNNKIEFTIDNNTNEITTDNELISINTDC